MTICQSLFIKRNAVEFMFLCNIFPLLGGTNILVKNRKRYIDYLAHKSVI